jgi:predicted flap endonuclease-1-like 5' DNA nuclease
LTSWKIDVKSESATAAKADEEGYKALMEISGIGEANAEKLFAAGLKSVAMLAAADAEQLAALPGVGEATAEAWIKGAGIVIDQEIGEK